MKIIKKEKRNVIYKMCASGRCIKDSRNICIQQQGQFFSIFGDEKFSFCELQTVPLAERLCNDSELLQKISVYDDGIVRGFVKIDGSEIEKLYVDVFFQGKNIGAELIEFAVKQGARKLWVLKKTPAG